MEFTLTINLDNAAFEGEGGGDAIAGILRSLADRIEGDPVSAMSSKVFDYNGNSVGKVVIS